MSITIRIGYGKVERVLKDYPLERSVLIFIFVSICVVPEHFSTPLYIARDLGFFEETGVKVELVLCPGKLGMARVFES